MSWFLCMVWNNGPSAARRKKGNFLHARTKGVILTKDDGKISLCAFTGWGWTVVKLGSEFLKSGVWNEPNIGMEAVREGGTHSLPGSCTLPRDIWEKKICLIPVQSPQSQSWPWAERVTLGGSGPSCAPGGSAVSPHQSWSWCILLTRLPFVMSPSVSFISLTVFSLQVFYLLG